MTVIREPHNYWHAVTKSSRHAREGCARKKGYDSEGRARGVGRDLLRLPEKAAEGLTRLWCYPCAVCRGWHLTRVENPRSAAITAQARWEGVPD